MSLNESFKQICEMLDRGEKIYNCSSDYRDAILNVNEAVVKFSIAVRLKKDQTEIERRAMNMIIGVCDAIYHGTKIKDLDQCLNIRMKELEEQHNKEPKTSIPNS